MAKSLKISDLQDTLGAYCREANDVIYEAIYGGIVSKNYFDSYGMIKDEEPLVRSILAENIVTSSVSDSFAGKADAVAPDARILQREDFDVDLVFTPDIIWKSWLGKYGRMRTSDPYYMPFEDFFIAEVVKKAANELEKQAIWKGIKDGTKVANKTANAGEVIDGLLKLIDVATADTDIPAANTTTYAALTTTNIVEQIEIVTAKALESGNLEGMDLVVLVSNTAKRNYARDYRDTSGGNMDFSGTKKIYEPYFVDGTDAEICACPGLIGTNAIIVTPRTNIKYTGVDPGDSIIIEKEKRQLNILMDFSWGANFVDPLVMFHNNAPEIDGVV